MASHKICCKYEESAQWLKHLSNNFPSNLDGQELTMKKPFGEGSLRYEVIQDGLFVHFLNFKVFDTVHVLRESIHSNEIFIVDFSSRKTRFIKRWITVKRKSMVTRI